MQGEGLYAVIRASGYCNADRPASCVVCSLLANGRSAIVRAAVCAIGTFEGLQGVRKLGPAQLYHWESAMRGLCVLVLVVTLAGCGTARTLVLEPVSSSSKYPNAELIAQNPHVDVPQSVTDLLESVIRKGLYDTGAFGVGSDLRIYYTFVSHQPGDRFQRWFWGGIGNAGEGSVTIMVRYVDASDVELAKTQVEGRIGSGFFGGSIDSAIEKAGDDVVKFTVNTFSVEKASN
jgi:hypothetical protein